MGILEALAPRQIRQGGMHESRGRREMKTWNGFARIGRAKLGSRAGGAVVSAVLLAICLAAPAVASGQTQVSGWQGGFTLSVGGTASGYYLGYGQRKLLGPSAFFDADTRRHFGVEGEARWEKYFQTADVHDTTWLIGPRYSIFPVNKKFYPYVRTLIGVGQFNFPYSYAKGNYLVIAPGAGLDYRIGRRIRIRVVDFEYQYWNQFTYGNLPSYGISSGIRVRVF
jgi:hypothetical protein